MCIPEVTRVYSEEKGFSYIAKEGISREQAHSLTKIDKQFSIMMQVPHIYNQ